MHCQSPVVPLMDLKFHSNRIMYDPFHFFSDQGLHGGQVGDGQLPGRKSKISTEAFNKNNNALKEIKAKEGKLLWHYLHEIVHYAYEF